MDNLKRYLQDHKSELDIDSPSDGLWNNIQQQTALQPKKGKIIKMVLRYAVAACVLGAVAMGIKWMADINKHPSVSIASNNKTPKDEKPGKQEDEKAGRVEDEKKIKLEDGKMATLEDGKTRKHEAKGKENIKRNMATIKFKTPKQLKVSPEEHAANELVSNLETGYAQLVKMQLQKVRSTPVLAEGPNYFNEFKMQLKQMDIDEANIRHDIKKNGLNDALLDQLINVYQQKLNVLKNLQTEINKMNNQVKQNKPTSDSTNSFYLNI